MDKSEGKMYLLSKNKIIKEYHVVFGANPKGHKRQEGDERTPEGDERTPEGDYILDDKKENSSFYKAMHISYPNKTDIKNARKRGSFFYFLFSSFCQVLFRLCI
ncbi:L,D-transpeptidase family protein [Halarcobacter ebronensis]|uniref:L,D-transpeptidase family protein n=1 Tax=Halarcobacter ebronensis TaxID=1462615 RepID=UPI002B3FFEA5|nr:L,D-transpeptidase family protein [Halarcobacter ebronensis]